MAVPYGTPGSLIPQNPLVSASGTYGLTAPSLQTGSMAQSRPSTPGSGLATPPVTAGPTVKAPPPPAPPKVAAPKVQPAPDPNQSMWNTALANDPLLNLHKQTISPSIGAAFTNQVLAPLLQKLVATGIPGDPGSAQDIRTKLAQFASGLKNPLTGELLYDPGNPATAGMIGNVLASAIANPYSVMNSIQQGQTVADQTNAAKAGLAGIGTHGWYGLAQATDANNAAAARYAAIQKLFEGATTSLSDFMSGAYQGGVNKWTDALGDAQTRIADMIGKNYYATPGQYTPGSTTPPGAAGTMGGLGINPGYVGQAAV